MCVSVCRVLYVRTCVFVYKYKFICLEICFLDFYYVIFLNNKMFLFNYFCINDVILSIIYRL